MNRIRQGDIYFLYEQDGNHRKYMITDCEEDIIDLFDVLSISTERIPMSMLNYMINSGQMWMSGKEEEAKSIRDNKKNDYT